MILYAPYAQVGLLGAASGSGTRLYGAVNSKSLTVGSTCAIHYDEAIGPNGPPLNPTGTGTASTVTVSQVQ
jgi:hypothetical protein